ncbi:MAG: DNA alkylation repair protein [Deltaproteobacteria bacterium]|jgi:3-methyladenine DNA glycosylase AlkC|nr:DNA alkylation repair protein [Deltaproteobacteria bacterium]
MKFKNYYNLEYARLISDKIKTVYPAFADEAFLAGIGQTLKDQEFSERMNLFAHAIDTLLPSDYRESLNILRKILGDELKTDSGMFTDGWWLWPIGRYVERRGIESVEDSLEFIEELTKRFTGEFAVRPLLQYAPETVLKVVEKWSKSDNVHVRRLSSEGLRIRLPWAKKLDVAVRHFDIYVRILTNLKDDDSRFVQKSVGNNLNDLYKDYPQKARQIIDGWTTGNPSKAALWIIGHGLRSAKKK